MNSEYNTGTESSHLWMNSYSKHQKMKVLQILFFYYLSASLLCHFLRDLGTICFSCCLENVWNSFWLTRIVIGSDIHAGGLVPGCPVIA